VADILISLVQKNNDSLYKGIERYLPREVMLVSQPHIAQTAKAVKNDLETKKVKVLLFEVKKEETQSYIEALSSLSPKKQKSVVVNIPLERGDLAAVFTACSHMHGFSHYMFLEGRIFELPKPTGSYFDSVSEKKFRILSKISANGGSMPFKKLAKELRFSPPLLSYHINGTYKSPGLIDLGLVKTKTVEGHFTLSTTQTAEMVLRCRKN
jgi:hypothetical protein